jgi:MscS family membrane protein
MSPTRLLAQADKTWWSPLFDIRWMNNQLWRWLALFGILLAGFVLGKIVVFLIHRHAENLRRHKPDTPLGLVLLSLARPVSLGLLAGALWLAGTLVMVLEPAIRVFWMRVAETIAVLATGWFIYRIVDIVEFYLNRWTARTQTQLDDQLVPMVRKTLRVFIVIVVLLFIAQNIFEWDIASLIAGLGIGGLAFALAAKDSLANIFGSVVILTDRPFQMGDRIKVQGHDGFVEEVGFRSTRIRTFPGHMVIIPNSIIANETIENVSARPNMRRDLEITITYDTPPEKVRQACRIVRDMLDDRVGHFPADLPGRVHFTNFNAASLGLFVSYWLDTTDWMEWLEFTHTFNLELLERFNAAGIEFAFPTQTIYVKPDEADETPESSQA